MKILMIYAYYKPAYVYGGPVNINSKFATMLKQLGNDVEVYTTNSNGTTKLKPTKNDTVLVDEVRVNYFPVSLNGLGFFFSFKLAYSLIKNIANFDLVITHLFYGFWGELIAPLCNSHKIPLIFQPQGQLMPWTISRHKWLKKIFFNICGFRFLKKVTAIQCTDESELEAVSSLGLKKYPFIIRHGVDLHDFDQLIQKGYLHKALQIPEEVSIIVVSGRLHSVKRPDIAIKALSLLQSKKPHLVFIGPDEQLLQKYLEELARAKGCSSRIHFLGLLDWHSVLNALSDSDILLMPSESENFGMSALEALAVGLPIITSRFVPIGRIAERNGVGKTCALCEKEFAVAIDSYLEIIHLSNDFGQKQKKFVQDNFDLLKITKSAQDEYKKIIGGTISNQ